jgi:hypothetical protein
MIFLDTIRRLINSFESCQALVDWKPGVIVYIFAGSLEGMEGEAG